MFESDESIIWFNSSEVFKMKLKYFRSPFALRCFGWNANDRFLSPTSFLKCLTFENWFKSDNERQKFRRIFECAVWHMFTKINISNSTKSPNNYCGFVIFTVDFTLRQIYFESFKVDCIFLRRGFFSFQSEPLDMTLSGLRVKHCYSQTEW